MDGFKEEKARHKNCYITREIISNLVGKKLRYIWGSGFNSFFIWLFQVLIH